MTVATAFVFPGQGSQFPGMGKDLYENFKSAREVFENVDDSLGHSLSAIIFDGPSDLLTATENAQPGLMAVSLAVIRVLEQDFGLAIDDAAVFAAGHSLGEYTALTASRSLHLDDAARLLRLRGQVMQKAVPSDEGAMAAILGLDMESLESVLRDSQNAGICVAANDNAAGQIVISGHKQAVDRAAALAKERGAKRAVMLPVSAPFHCPLMEPAAEAMAEALTETVLRKPVIPVVANVTARPAGDVDTIRRNLVDQVCGRVRWRETMDFLAQQGVSRIVECGAGKVLSGLARRIGISAQALETAAEIEDFAKAFTAEQSKEEKAVS